MHTLEERAYWLKQAHLLDEELGTEAVYRETHPPP